MPSRILREGILDSEAVNKLSFPAEVFYRRLMSVVDDFGRFDGRPGVLRSRLYPLKVESVREADITRWIAECEKAGLIVLYAVDLKPYVLFHKLGPPRAKESKFPAPPAGTPSRPPRADAITCAQAHADVPYSDSSSDSDSGSDSGAPPQPPAKPGGGRRAAKELDPRFAKFWAAYPRKVARPDAERAFAKIAPDDALLAAMLAALDWQRKSFDWTKDGGRFVPYPASWLNGRRWEDSRPAEGTGDGAAAGGTRPGPGGVVGRVGRAEPGPGEYDAFRDGPAGPAPPPAGEGDGASRAA